jgi:PTS system galactitol-specific IIC component
MNAAGIIQYLLGYGAAVFMPVIIFLLGLLVRLKPSKALRSGLLMGVAFTGMMLVIVSLFYTQVAPAASAMVTRLGLSLNILDIGWTPSAAIAWAWPAAATMFLVQIVINLVMLALNWTKTLNVDMWNVWQKAFIGAVVVAVTGSYILAYLVVAVWIILELKFGDWSVYQVHEYIGVPGISIPHSEALGLMISAPVDWVVQKIPGLNKLKADPTTLREKFGLLGENMFIGAILGILMGILAGYNIKAILQLAVNAATALVLLPMIAKLFMEALAPLSEAAGEFMKARFPGREFFIGLDWPILAGNPSTYAVGILCVPLLLIFCLILPGNKTLVFGSIADWAWMVSSTGAIVGGDVIRMLLVSLVLIPAYLYTATYIGPATTMVAKQIAFAMPENTQTITWFGTNPLYMFEMKSLEILQGNFTGIIWLAALIFLVWFARRVLLGREKEAAKRLGIVEEAVEEVKK